jgi:hypothetical protein
MVPDLETNCCGMLLRGLDAPPFSDGVLRKAQGLKRQTVVIDGVPIGCGFGISNHFISLLRVEPLAAEVLPPYVFILHCSGGELQGQTSLGDGLCWGRSEALHGRAEVFETPFGPARVLLSSQAVALFTIFQRAEAFAKKRRCVGAECLFRDHRLISSENRQGPLNVNEMVLGAVPLRVTDATLPITL